MSKVHLTPMQDLIMEVLAARWRLGEQQWPFDSKVSGALRLLEEAGLVNLMHGIVEHTVRASLTLAGQEMYLSPTYLAPAVDKRVGVTAANLQDAWDIYLSAMRYFQMLYATSEVVDEWLATQRENGDGA